jgi:hypothetical protein
VFAQLQREVGGRVSLLLHVLRNASTVDAQLGVLLLLLEWHSNFAHWQTAAIVTVYNESSCAS